MLRQLTGSPVWDGAACIAIGGGFTVTIQTCSLYGLPILGPPLCSLLG